MSADETACPCCQKPERRPSGVAVFEPGEFGYHCPLKHTADALTWSEWVSHLWCYTCKKDYPTSTCPISRPSWMSVEKFQAFLAGLPFAPLLTGETVTGTW